MKSWQEPFRPVRCALPLWAAALLCATGSTARAEEGVDQFSARAVAAYSPVPERVRPLEAVHQARAYVAAHPGTDFLVGSGSSMLPLYKDHTVIVTQPLEIHRLRPGMTVVFIDGNGLPVAHVLVRLTASGWISMGIGNPECDPGRISDDNYVGVVVRAFEPTGNPLQALLDRAAAAPIRAVAVSSAVRVAPLRPRSGVKLATMLP
jgi:hypothetical protein